MADRDVTTFPHYKYLYHERILQALANSIRRDARNLLTLAAEVPVSKEVEVFTLEDAKRALLALKQSKIRGAGVLKVS